MDATGPIIVTWDLETTGFDAEKGEILEVAALVTQDGNVVKEYSALINHNVDIPEEASKIHGITRELIDKEGKDPADVFIELITLLNDCDIHITHNGFKFDIPFLLKSLNKFYTARGMTTDHLHDFEDRLYAKGKDTAVIYKAREMGYYQEESESFENFATRVMNVRVYGLKYNVSACCDTLGIDRSQIQLHRAMGDVYLTNEIYKKLMSGSGPQ